MEHKKIKGCTNWDYCKGTSSKERKYKDTIISMSRKKVLNYIIDINMKTQSYMDFASI